MASKEISKPPLPPIQFEYLDHTADIQIHAWGKDVKEAFIQSAYGMMDYMTERKAVSVDPEKETEITAKGHDLQSLLFGFLDEVLFTFEVEHFVPRSLEIKSFDTSGEEFTITVIGHGEEFIPGKHPQGTEVKAITYSNMQILEKDDRVDVYVIVDI